MTAKRLFIPDDVMSATKVGTDKNVRLLQYISATTTENFDVFLTHNALAYILSGIKQIKVAQSGFQINREDQKQQCGEDYIAKSNPTAFRAEQARS